MTLGELAAAIATEEASHWTIGGEGVLAVPYSIIRLKSGLYRVFVRTKAGEEHVLTFAHHAKSIFTDPLEYELR